MRSVPLNATDSARSSEGNLITQPPANSTVSPGNIIPPRAHCKINPPVKGTAIKNRRQTKYQASLTDYATPAPAVSAFCRAVLYKILPTQFFGDGHSGHLNRKQIMKHVDAFIKMRRFESPSLHEVCHGLKVSRPFFCLRGLAVKANTAHSHRMLRLLRFLGWLRHIWHTRWAPNCLCRTLRSVPNYFTSSFTTSLSRS